MNTTEAMDFGFGGIWGIIMLLIIAGLFTNGGFGFGNNARNDISNEFLYNQLANDVRANGQAINNTDRDVLTTSCNTEKAVMQSTYDTQLGLNQLGNAMSSCCCDIKGLVRDEIQSVKDLINNNTIQDLRDTKQGYELVAALGNQSNLISQRFGSWYLNAPISPYYNTYGYNGTTIY